MRHVRYQLLTVLIYHLSSVRVMSDALDSAAAHVAAPRGAGTPHFPPCPFTSSSFALFLLFPFLGGFNYFLLLPIPFLSTRILPLCCQAGGRRKQPNPGLVCCIYFVLSVFLS